MFKKLFDFRAFQSIKNSFNSTILQESDETFDIIFFKNFHNAKSSLKALFGSSYHQKALEKNLKIKNPIKRTESSKQAFDKKYLSKSSAFICSQTKKLKSF